MGLAHRVIPTILCRGRQLVKGEKFNAWRSVGLAAQAVRIHQMRGVDELVLLDITATAEGRGPDLDMVTELSEVCFMPLAVGGGVRSVADVKALLRAGADKVVIGSAYGMVVDGKDLFQAIADTVGSQALVAALNVRMLSDTGERARMPQYMDKRHLILETADVDDAAALAEAMAARGAGEIMLTSVEREGTMQGYDLDLIRKVSKAVSVPVIAHGGCGTYEHMREALDAGASAVAAGAMFQFTDQTPKGAVKYLAEKGIEVRL